jgi:hypothetical protein
MIKRIDAQSLQALKILILNIERGGFQQDLELIIVLEPVGIVSVPAIGRPSGRLDISHIPGLRPKGL